MADKAVIVTRGRGGAALPRRTEGGPVRDPCAARTGGTGPGPAPADQPSVQATPLSVKLAGPAPFPVWLTWKPMAVLPPAGMDAL